jgi:Tfp pilus assembly protein PilN
VKTRINLATAPLENHRRFIAGAGLVGVLGVIAMVVLSIYAYHGWRANHDLRVDIAGYESQINKLAARQGSLRAFFKLPPTVQVMDRAAFLNTLIKQRSFPWTNLFMDLERILPPGVRVVSISPRMASDHVEIRLLVGASSDESKLKFLKALEESRVFSAIQVRQENRSKENSPDRDPIQIELVTWYSTT